jgi:hypothetical protein
MVLRKLPLKFALKLRILYVSLIFSSLERKRQYRAKKAIEEGRLPGIPGRPGLTDYESEKFIISKIREHADFGVFHEIGWLAEMVKIYCLC